MFYMWFFVFMSGVSSIYFLCSFSFLLTFSFIIFWPFPFLHLLSCTFSLFLYSLSLLSSVLTIVLFYFFRLLFCLFSLSHNIFILHFFIQGGKTQKVQCSFFKYISSPFSHKHSTILGNFIFVF